MKKCQLKRQYFSILHIIPEPEISCSAHRTVMNYNFSFQTINCTLTMMLPSSYPKATLLEPLKLATHHTLSMP